MALSSRLEADFSDFVTETKKANAALTDMQAEAAQTATAFQRSSVVVGQFGTAADKSSSGFTTLTGGMRTADKMLGQFGVNIGSEINALEELGQVAGKSASQVGLIGTAGAAAAAGLLGWQIGSFIADVTSLDERLGDLLITMGLFPSAQKAGADAAADMMRRARELDPAVRTAAQAIEVLDDAARKGTEQWTSGAASVRRWNEELKHAEADGLPGLRKEIEKGVLTVDQMARRYDISKEAVQHFTKQVQEDTRAHKEATAAYDAQLAALQEIAEANKGQAAILDTLSDAQREAAETALTSGIAQGTVAKAYGLTAQQVKAVADEIKNTEDAVKKLGEAEDVVSKANQTWNDEIVKRSGTTTQALIADVERWRTEQIAALDATEGATQEHYDKIEGIANEKLVKIKVDWDVLRDGAIATLADQAARAGATYQEMLQHSSAYTAGAIENARQVAEATQASFDQMSGAHSAAYAEFAKRDKAYADSLKEFQTAATTGQQQKWDAELAAMDRAIAYSQTYGVTIDAAKQALGQMGDAGAKAGQDTKASVDQAASSVQTLGSIATQSAAQMSALAAHYQRIADDTMQQGGAAAFWSPAQMAQNYADSAQKWRDKAGRQAQYESQISGQAWGNRGMTSTTTNLSVNVNNSDAQGIASKLIEEMRHSGVRFG